MVGLGTELRKYKAKKVGTDPGTDVALLKIDEKNLPAITFADSEKARAGDIVLAVGNPFGLRQTVTMGIISAIGRSGMGIVDYENFIQPMRRLTWATRAARWSISKANCSALTLPFSLEAVETRGSALRFPPISRVM